jgi:hypothetical protein
MYNHSFVVEGYGSFPIDMLRYDSCFPASGEDVARMRDDHSRRQVRLSAIWSRAYLPTKDRWSSFSWVVISVNKPTKMT